MQSQLGEGRIVVGAARTERADAIDLVRRWFDAVAAADLAKAAMLMAEPCTITISGGHRFTCLEEFVAYGARRYQAVHKRADQHEACEAAGGLAVYVTGEMSGSWADGLAFAGVRWCDRFLLRSGRIVDLQTWSDLAETRIG
jgi:ketosteroid isomerase-like protein